MSNYNPDFFSSQRVSEQLVSVAKDRLDELGYSHLKKELDDALFGKDQPKPGAINLGDKLGDKKGWMI
ncbi:hypothetical protein EBR57_00655 [bacterium]|nr:hypothetical protein [bacterium]